MSSSRPALTGLPALSLLATVLVGVAACSSSEAPDVETSAPPAASPSATAAETTSAPRTLGEDELTAFARDRGLVYWAGERDGYSIELTVGSSATFVRYLPDGVDPGSDEPALTIATYPDVDGPSALENADDADTQVAESGAIIVNPAASPENVYFAFPGSTFQVEVYSPVEGEALALTNDGSIRPVVPQEQP